MSKKKTKKNWLHWSHVVFMILVGVLLFVLFSAGSTKESVKDIDYTLTFSNASFDEIPIATEEGVTNETKAIHTWLFTLKNDFDIPLDCYLNFTISWSNETNSSIFDVPSLDPQQELEYSIEFEMPRGNSSLDLISVCT